jgi:hypothetical protein
MYPSRHDDWRDLYFRQKAGCMHKAMAKAELKCISKLKWIGDNELIILAKIQSMCSWLTPFIALMKIYFIFRHILMTIINIVIKAGYLRVNSFYRILFHYECRISVVHIASYKKPLKALSISSYTEGVFCKWQNVYIMVKEL